jgi:hypothetical protein
MDQTRHFFFLDNGTGPDQIKWKNNMDQKLHDHGPDQSRPNRTSSNRC